MKSLYTKLFTFLAVIFFLVTLVTNLFSFDDGITGLTKRYGGVGCVCHGFHVPDSTVHVFFTGLDSVAVGQTVYGKLKIVGGPHIAGGLDVATWRGVLDTTYLDTILRKEIQHYEGSDSGWEVTHRFPKPFINDTCTFIFKYTAPNTVGYDTIYANGNSVNLDSIPDTLDAWNFSDNKPIRIYVPIGIENISSVAYSYSLSQNYPNPFNPSTNIDFSLPREGNVRIDIYDAIGRLVRTVVNQNMKAGTYKEKFDASLLTSGIYFYRITAGDFIQTRKMVLLK